MAGFVHILPKNWVKTAHIFFFLQCIISACLLSKKQKLYINEHQDKNSHVPVKVKNPRKKKDE